MSFVIDFCMVVMLSLRLKRISWHLYLLLPFRFYPVSVLIAGERKNSLTGRTVVFLSTLKTVQIPICGGKRSSSPLPRQFSEYQLGVLQFTSILTRSTWKEQQISQVKGSVLWNEPCPFRCWMQGQAVTCASDQPDTNWRFQQPLQLKCCCKSKLRPVLLPHWL